MRIQRGSDQVVRSDGLMVLVEDAARVKRELLGKPIALGVGGDPKIDVSLYLNESCPRSATRPGALSVVRAPSCSRTSTRHASTKTKFALRRSSRTPASRTRATVHGGLSCTGSSSSSTRAAVRHRPSLNGESQPPSQPREGHRPTARRVGAKACSEQARLRARTLAVLRAFHTMGRIHGHRQEVPMRCRSALSNASVVHLAVCERCENPPRGLF